MSDQVSHPHKTTCKIIVCPSCKSNIRLNMWNICVMIVRGKNRTFLNKRCFFTTFFLPQMPYGLIRDRTLAFAVKGWQLESCKSMWNHSLWNHSLWNHSLWNHFLWNHSLWNHSLWNAPPHLRIRCFYRGLKTRPVCPSDRAEGKAAWNRYRMILAEETWSTCRKTCLSSILSTTNLICTDLYRTQASLVRGRRQACKKERDKGGRGCSKGY